MAKDTYYFSHDYNARTDKKIKKLLAKHGYLGYGVFWAIVEDLYNNGNTLPTEFETIAFDLKVSIEIVKSVVCDFEFFEVNDTFFMSPSIKIRLDRRDEKTTKAKLAAAKRWETMQTQCIGNADAMQTHSERNAIKGKEIKGKERVFVVPSAIDVVAYFLENGYSEYAAKRAYNHYSVAEWKDTQGKPVKNWKQKMQTNWFKPENKIVHAAPKSVVI